MSGFIANASPTTAAAITNALFWPDVDLDVVRARMRLDGSVTADRLREATVAAMLSVNDSLAAWRAGQQAAGYDSLDEVPGADIGGVPRVVALYLRAVCCAVGAELAERYRSYDATDGANQRADDLTPSISELRRDLAWALSDLQGRPRCTVELI
ncbi:head completion/stabilization protein [Xanthomonas translucens]|uniref:head completion/stabilization protein n=1 Tax=Xanthomonas campestris pv. translucens TaxID=343 RepID=UPI00071E88FE|nr:head completion/stabilization protein [Xanthomonas translucens]KTF40702.1 head completion/stabilization protein [Xanthomonas translucens pv. translucens]QSQ38937.1 head completion/stabilization protein [Xanthomonas translucens pv. translucens]UII65665.1 head completion/stabilization protein [Xanthomonas translucens]